MSKRYMLVGSACLIIGPIVAAYGTPNLIDAMRSSGWPSVDGLVVASEVVRTGGGRGSTGYRPRVVYQYEVHGKALEADRVSHGEAIAKTQQHASHIVGRYPVGSNVPVFYDPDSPESAALETGFGIGAVAIPGFGAAVFLAGVAYVGLALRRRIAH